MAFRSSGLKFAMRIWRVVGPCQGKRGFFSKRFAYPPRSLGAISPVRELAPTDVGGYSTGNFRAQGSCLDNLPHFLYRRSQIARVEECGAADEGVGAGFGAFARRLAIYSAVHADSVTELAFSAPRFGLLNLGQRLIDERLPPEPRIDRHDEQRIYLLQIRLDQGDSCRWVDRQAYLFAKCLDFPKQRRDLLAQRS